MDKPQQGSNTPLPLWPALLLVAIALAVAAGSALAAALVKNGSFEKDTNGDGFPNKWAGLNLTAGDKRVCNQSAAGQCSFKMVGNGIADGPTKYFLQIVAVSGLDGDEFSLSFWTKGKEIVLGSGGFATVFVQFNWVGGGNNSHYFNTPAGTSAWTSPIRILRSMRRFAAQRDFASRNRRRFGVGSLLICEPSLEPNGSCQHHRKGCEQQ